MATMTPDAYINHIPTLTGGYGARELHRFYKYHFVPRLPADTALGVAPIGKYVEVPLVAVIEFRGDKVYNEHIY